jgi:hypothetical protein
MKSNQKGKMFKATFAGVVLLSVTILMVDFVAMSLYIIDCLKARVS